MSDKKFIDFQTLEGVLVGRVLVHTLSEYESGVVFADISAPAAPAAPNPRIVLNCEEVEMIASAGIGMFINLQRQCKDNGGAFAAFGLNKDIVNVLRLTRMDRVFTLAESQEEAITAVK